MRKWIGIIANLRFIVGWEGYFGQSSRLLASSRASFVYFADSKTARPTLFSLTIDRGENHDRLMHARPLRDPREVAPSLAFKGPPSRLTISAWHAACLIFSFRTCINLPLLSANARADLQFKILYAEARKGPANSPANHPISQSR